MAQRNWPHPERARSEQSKDARLFIPSLSSHPFTRAKPRYGDRDGIRSERALGREPPLDAGNRAEFLQARELAEHVVAVEPVAAQRQQQEPIARSAGRDGK